MVTRVRRISVFVRQVGAVDAGKGSDIAPAQHQCLDADQALGHSDAAHVHVHIVDGAALQGDAAFECEHVGDVDACITDGRGQHVLAHVQQHRTVCVPRVDGHAGGFSAVGEVHHHAIPVALVELDQNVFEGELQLLGQAYHGNLLASGAQRGEGGALRH